jgi:hypothetical protein
MKEQFLISAIQAKLQNEKLSPELEEINTRGWEEFKSAGIWDKISGKAIAVPANYRATVTGGSDSPTAGTDVNLSFTALEDVLVFARAGASFFTNLRANLKFPLPSRVTVTSELENGENDDGGTQPGSITFIPRLRLTTRLEVSKQLLLQSDTGAEAWLWKLIIEAIAAKLESYIGGVQASSASMIQGIGLAAAATANTVPSFSSLIAMETAVNNTNGLRGKLGWITSGKGHLIMKQIPRESGMGFPSVWEDDKVNGYPAFHSNSISNEAGTTGNGSLLMLADWSRLGICQFGGYDVTPDPFSRAVAGIVRLNINTYFDVRGLSGYSESNEYINSFAVLPIAAS